MSVPLRTTRRANAPQKSSKVSRKTESVAQKKSKWDLEKLKAGLHLTEDDQASGVVDVKGIVKLAEEHIIEASTALSTSVSNKSKLPNAKETEAIGEICRAALTGLRHWSTKKVEIERRASALSSKFIALDALKCAQNILDDMRSYLLQLYEHDQPSENPFTLPVPRSNLDADLLNLLTTTLVHYLYVYADHPDYISSLTIPGSFWSWSHLASEITLKRAYTALSKSPKFSARILALKCILKTPDVEPDPFWGQTCNFAATYARSVGEGNSEQEQTCREVSQAFGELVGLVEERELFLEGQNFVKFCKHWISFARKLRDISTIERVSQYLQESPARDHALETAQLCARLLRINTALDNSDEDTVKEMEECISLLSRPSHKKALADPQVVSETDKLRKHCVELLDKGKVPKGKVKDAVAKLTFALVRPTRVHLSLDSLFVLSRTTIDVTDTLTWTTAYEYLAKALALHSPCTQGKDSAESTHAERATFLRVTANAYYNVGGSLYNAERHGGALRFLVKAAEVFKDALILHASEGGSDAQNEWDACYKRLPKLYEVIGRCNLKIGDRRAAYDAYIVSLKHALRIEGPALPLSDEICLLIERITHIGISELFLLPEDLSLSSKLLEAKELDLPQGKHLLEAGVLGAVLEVQIDFLRNKSKRKDAKTPIKALMFECISVYRDEMPMHRVRLQLRMMEYAFQHDDKDVDVVLLAQDIQQLLSSQAPSADVNSDPLPHLYTAGAEVWLAFTRHVKKEPPLVSQPDPYLLSHISRVAAILQEWKRTRCPQAPKAKSKAPAAKGGSSRKKRNVAPPKTPKATQAMTSMASKVSKGKCKAFDHASHEERTRIVQECSEMLQLLETCAQFAGLMGQIIPKIQILDAVRALAEEQLNDYSEVFVRVSISLALELGKVGLTKIALAMYGRVEEILKAHVHTISEELEVLVALRSSELLCCCQEDISRSLALYEKAFNLSENLVTRDYDPKEQLPFNHVLSRVSMLERAAVAATVFANIAAARDELAVSLRARQQAIRLWGRAAEILAKYNAPNPNKKPVRSDSPNPFSVTELKEAVNEIVSPPSADDAAKKDTPSFPSAWLTFHRTHRMDGTEWRVADGLLTSMCSMIQHLLSRGSVKAARRFIEDAEAFSESLGSVSKYANILTQKADLLVQLDELEAALPIIEKANNILSTFSGPEKTDAHRVHGIHYTLSEKTDDADAMYDNAITVLQALETKFTAACSGFDSLVARCKDTSQKATKDIFLSEMVADILQETVWLYRDDQSQDFEGALELLTENSQTRLQQGPLNLLLGKLAMYNAHECFRGSLSFSSLAESTISVPLGIVSADQRVTMSTRDVASLLTRSEQLFSEAIVHLYHRGAATKTRECFVSLALTRAFLTSLGSSTPSGPVLLANALDLSCAVTLQREMVEAIDYKLAPRRAVDDIIWPSWPSTEPSAADEIDGDPTEDVNIHGLHFRKYWQSVRKRYAEYVPNPESLSISQVDGLRSNWTVVTIGTTEDRSAMLISRQRPKREPLVFYIPLERHGRKEEGVEEQQLSYDAAMAELNEVISSSNEQARQAKEVEGSEAKIAWWTQRRLLNTRLKELLENIEFCWLGAFKAVLNEPRQGDPDLFSDLRTRIEGIFSRALRLNAKAKAFPQLDDVLLECFSTLSPKSRDEELEDLVYFLLDLYQLHGMPVALAELDTDQVVVEMRSALEEFAAKAKEMLQPIDDAHLFLVLDKNVQGIPWESIPILRGKSVSRIPCTSFLLDRMEATDTGSEIQAATSVSYGALVNPRKTFYVMNPGGDLKHTENEFRDWARGMESVGWRGVIGREPMEFEILNALEKDDLFIYFGHGNGEQFVRSRKLRHLRRCAATMLWGCSSGLMREMGTFDRTGTPNHYMIAGCPTLVANLWDVTDRDMDKYTHSVFSKLRLNKERVGQWTKQDRGMSVVAAVAQSRVECKMDYLVGAAPVVYGVPFYL